MAQKNSTRLKVPAARDAKRPLKRKTPRQNRSETTVANILQAAHELAAAEGFEKLTTPRIAQRAGISVGSLYQYFANRESIYLAMYESVSSKCAVAVREALLDVIHEPPESGIRTMVVTTLKLYESNALILLKLPRDIPELRPHISGLMSFDGLIRATVKTYMQLHLPRGAKRQMETQIFLMESSIVHAVQRYALERPELVSREKFISDVTSTVVAYMKREAQLKKAAGSANSRRSMSARKPD